MKYSGTDRARRARRRTLAGTLIGAGAALWAASWLSATQAAAPQRPHCLPAQQGYLRARLRGARDTDINWRGDVLQCDGDPRPDGHGIRLTFAGVVEPGHHHLRLVFGIEAPPGARVMREVPANVTLIFEGERRLYSTRGDSQCTVDALQEQALAGTRARGLLRVSARGFCIGPAIAVAGSNGGDELLVSRFDFAGLLRSASAGG